MPRIRTVKPEAFASESLAAVSLTAERTFFGLLTQADDHGRFRDQPAVLAGLLWSLRPGHGPLGVEEDLVQLSAEGLVCRYEVEGRRYLHIVTFRQHQRINRPSGVRHPDCPVHDVPQTTQDGAALAQKDTVPSPEVKKHAAVNVSSGSPQTSRREESTGQLALAEASMSPHPDRGEGGVSAQGPDLGSRNVDLGSSPSGGASAPAPHPVSAQQLLGEYIAACAHRPPRGVLGHLGREITALLAEGIAPEHIRAGLARHRAKGLHPSTLPSLVHEAMNGSRPGSTSKQPAHGHRAWANPADPAAAYAEEL